MHILVRRPGRLKNFASRSGKQRMVELAREYERNTAGDPRREEIELHALCLRLERRVNYRASEI
jgi:hypothetical protein